MESKCRFLYVGSVSFKLESQTQIDHGYNISEKARTGSSTLTFIENAMGQTQANGIEGYKQPFSYYSNSNIDHRSRTEVFLSSNC